MMPHFALVKFNLFQFLTLGAHAQRGVITVLGLCVCLHLFSPYRDQAGSSAISTTLAQQGLEKLCGNFA